MGDSAFEWGNRVRFVVKNMYDLDNNGYLDVHDFECLALKYTILEGKGMYSKDAHEKNKTVMISLWMEIAELADFNKDGQVTTEEFQSAVQNVCVGKKFDQFPQSLKHAINCKFMGADINGDGLIGIDEFRLDCVSRAAFDSIEEIDNCYNKLLNDDDRKKDGINKTRYQELFAEFIAAPEANVPGAYLFGPLDSQ